MKKLYSHPLLGTVLITVFSFLLFQSLYLILALIIKSQVIGILVALLSFVSLIYFEKYINHDGKKMWKSLKVNDFAVLAPVFAMTIIMVLYLIISKNHTFDIKLKYLELAIMAGFTEEIAFRAIPIAFASKTKVDNGIYLKVAFITSFLFSISHLTNIFGDFGIGYVLLQTISAFCFGLFMSAVLIKTKAILPLIFAHSLYDFIAFQVAPKFGMILSLFFNVVYLILAIRILSKENTNHEKSI